MATTTLTPSILRHLFQNGGIGPKLNGEILPIEEGAGLALDPDTGEVWVDFDTMSTERFENMLKALTIPIYMTGNKSFYVNGETGSDDTSIEGIGESKDKPFKTIQACANYVCTFYNVNSHYANIQVASGTYDEQLTLGGFSATTGHIRITAQDGAGTVTISNTTMGNLVTVTSGGRWRFYNLKFRLSAQPNTSMGSTVHAVIYIQTNSEAHEYNCNFYAEDVKGTIYGNNNMRIIWCESGTFGLHPGDATQREMTLVANSVFNNYYAFVASYGGNLTFSGDNNSSDAANFYVGGAFTDVLNCFNAGRIQFIGGPVYPPLLKQSSSRSCTGVRYRVQSGAGINSGNNTSSSFPGSKDGVVSSSSGAWFA